MFYTLLPLMLFIFGACGDDTDVTEEETTIPVYISTVEMGSIDRSIRYIGTLAGEREVRILSKIPDKVVELKADEGDFVEEGEILAIIDNKVLKEAVDQAEAAIRIARANFNNIQREYERSKRLYDQEAISSQQFDQVETQFENAQASLEQAQASLIQAKENYNDSYIKAPFDGILSERFLEIGDMAAGGVPVFNIIQTDNVKVSINVVDREYNYIHEGQHVRLRVRSHPDMVFNGVVTKKRPAFDPITRLAKIEIMFPNEDGSLHPGMFGEVELVIDSKDNIPLVPAQALLYRIELDESLGRLIDEQLVRQAYVYVIENDRAARRDVQIGYETQDFVEITSGIEPGEQIVVRGQNNLTDGSRVNVADDVEFTSGGGKR